MAYSFNRSGCLIASGSAISLPDGDWSIGGWAHLDSSGTAAPVLLGQDSSDDAYYALIYYEDHHPDQMLSDRLTVSIRDDSGFSSRLDSDDWYIVRGDWRHVLVQREADTIRLYVDGTADSKTAAACGAVTIAANNVFGRLGSLRLAEWAQWNRALDADERAALAGGWSPQFFPQDRMWHLPMVRELEELDGALVLSWTDVGVAAHPSIFRPATLGGRCAAAGSSESSSSSESSESSSSSDMVASSDTPAGWMPPYRTVAGTVWHTGAVAGRTLS